MLKTWNFTENTLYHRCFDYNWQKTFDTTNYELLLLIDALLFGLCLDN